MDVASRDDTGRTIQSRRILFFSLSDSDTSTLHTQHIGLEIDVFCNIENETAEYKSGGK